ncbi:MAG: pyridoxamine 5'-phosphate oxidase family protein [bacterium]
MNIPKEVEEMIRGNIVILVATSSLEGVPHLAAARGMTLVDKETVSIKDWLCLQSLDNLSENPRVALSLMDEWGQRGFQLIGTVEMGQVEEMLDGYMSEDEGARLVPQTRSALTVRVERVLELCLTPHPEEN